MGRIWLGKVLRCIRVGLPVVGLIGFSVLALTSWHDELIAATPADRQTLAAPPAAVAPRPPAERPDRAATLRPGGTLSSLLVELGVDRREVQPIAAAASRYLDPRQLTPGLRAAAYGGAGARPSRLELALAGRGELRLERRGEGWEPAWRPFARETRVRVVRGSLAGSLEGSVERAGADPNLAYAMAEVLQWDIDFTRDLKAGDRFAALYEEVYLEGEYFGLGRVLALSYAQTHREIEAYRYGEGASFYDAEGRPLEKLFLRSPLPYSRVTSRFSSRRFHPVLKAHRPHYGVDYGAPVGTPVRVTASGTVTSAGWDGGGGKTVKVRHANGYLTGYLHLSRFASGVRAGVRVRQGDVIGYVGSTGLATGPHLDYRVQLNGRWIDPLSLQSVPAQPLSTLELASFRASREPMRRSLASGIPQPLPGVEAGLGQAHSAALVPAPTPRDSAKR